MNEDPSVLNAPVEAVLPVTESTVSEFGYIESAALTDVMFEQLDYLLSHGHSACDAGCRECNRLQQVKHWLLVPFHSPTH